jgi:hypothetical protein
MDQVMKDFDRDYWMDAKERSNMELWMGLSKRSKQLSGNSLTFGYKINPPLSGWIYNFAIHIALNPILK